MKLYRIDHLNTDYGTIVSWTSSKRMAEYERRKLAADYKDDPQGTLPEIDITAVEVPTQRKALVAWLNQHLNRDNG